MNAYTETRTMHPRGAASFERVYLYCPEGHECGSAPTNSPTGMRYSAGDFTGESCGNTSCDWAGDK